MTIKQVFYFIFCRAVEEYMKLEITPQSLLSPTQLLASLGRQYQTISQSLYDQPNTSLIKGRNNPIK